MPDHNGTWCAHGAALLIRTGGRGLLLPPGTSDSDAAGLRRALSAPDAFTNLAAAAGDEPLLAFDDDGERLHILLRGTTTIRAILVSGSQIDLTEADGHQPEPGARPPASITRDDIAAISVHLGDPQPARTLLDSGITGVTAFTHVRNLPSGSRSADADRAIQAQLDPPSTTRASGATTRADARTTPTPPESGTRSRLTARSAARRAGPDSTAAHPDAPGRTTGAPPQRPNRIVSATARASTRSAEARHGGDHR